MGLATPPPRPTTSKPAAAPRAIHFGSISMSQGFHQGIFSFSDGFDRSAAAAQASQHHIAQQSRRDKLRGVHGFDPSGHPLVPPIDDDDDDGGPTGGDHHHGYEPGSAAGNMLSEMFNFPPAPGGPSATDLLASQISAGYRMPVGRQGGDVGFSGEWYGGGRPQGLNADSAAAMQLFLMNPPQAPPHQPASPNQAYQAAAVAAGSFGVGESQGLSLSLSSSLQQFEMAKAAADHQNELRVRDGVLYFNNTGQQPQQQQLLSPSSLHLHGQQSQGHGQPGQQQQHMGYGGGGGHMAVVNVLRSSKYARAAQELLEEFCSVGRGQLKGSRIGRHHGASSSSNPNNNNNNNNNPSSTSAGAGGAGSSSSAKEPPPLSPADRFEHQRKKSKLLSMLDEVDRRYNHYCDQMQLVVNSFDSVMGFGAATPYTALAQKAMSRHFRCLKDAIAAQLKKTCELLGEKDAGAAGAGSGITKGETPRLRLLDQSLRQQRAFHQMGMMEQEAWRPQRGLPERSVSILRAWLFEHFLHPYPSDADKHLLARQTGLSRNQVSNWFINARVRLWKPMVEEMYQQESKDEGAEDGQAEEGAHQRAEDGQRAESEAPESSPSPASISRHHHMFPSDHPPAAGAHQPADESGPIQLPVIDPHELCGPDEDLYRQYGAATAAAVRFGAASATTGDVTLTLGLRHAGNAPEKGRFSVRDFGGI